MASACSSSAAMVGLLSGMFGVGGGFILTPLLFFIGIPPAVAVASAANQIAGSSFSAFLAHWQRRTVDFKMGMVLLAGGVLGSTLGVQIFTALRKKGQFELVVSLLYVVHARHHRRPDADRERPGAPPAQRPERGAHRRARATPGRTACR